MNINEEMIEQVAISTLESIGYTRLSSEEAAPDAIGSQRATYQNVMLQGRLRTAVERLNPLIPDDVIDEALQALECQEMPSLVEENRRVHRMLVNGIDVEYPAEDGTIRGDKVWLIDFAEPENNDWVVTNQFRVVEGKHHRRADIVVFLNGMPVVVIELKNPANERSSTESAVNQLKTYKAEIPTLFRANCLLVASDGLTARAGSLTADWERFMPWRSVTGGDGDFSPKGKDELNTLLRGVFEKSHFLSLIRDFTVFADKGDGLFKIVAGYHQFFGARKAFRRAIEASSPEGDRRIGVIWHTQGSGKSLLMTFFGGLLVRSIELKNPTLVILTDRNDLDSQLFGTFGMCKDLIRQTPKQANSREGLRKLLDRNSGGVIFTTMQKFSPPAEKEDFPVLTDRRNVIVIVDEAHRSQYGFGAKFDSKTGKIGYGYAHYVRQALPNASFIGFTGTPIESADTSTYRVFGEGIDVYDISRAVEDEVTVPIHYQSRLARIELDEDEKPLIDTEIEEILEDDSLSEQEKKKAKWATVEALVGSEKRLSQIAADLVDHLEQRLEALDGKAMAVCMSRRICVALYEQIRKRRPKWHSDDDDKGEIKVVMTGSASDPEGWQPHIRNKGYREKIAKRARDPDDPLKLVIVRDMWLTGFDAPCTHTMYVDKPMRGHNLMQAIARVNRVFKDKPGGLIVDYIGIFQNLNKALQDYSESDRKRVGVKEEDAVAVLKEKLDIVRAMFYGLDYSLGITGEPGRRLAAIGDAMERILGRQEEAAAKVEDAKEKEKARDRFQLAVSELGKAFALASTSDFARKIKEDVGFFQAVRAAIIKQSLGEKLGSRTRGFAIEQLIDQAVASAEIVDILKAAGLKSPDISILSNEFLLEIQNMKHKNLALDALKKLLAGEISRIAKKNIVRSKAFSKRLEEAVSRYHSNAISTVEVIQELIELAKDMEKLRKSGGDKGISEEEMAFYETLTENNSAVEVMGNENLRIIAVELLQKMKSNVTVDWHKKESARARMRSLVRRILKNHGYPPDLSTGAVQTVIAQAEAVLAELSPNIN
ncbi:MAG: type I restriction endonuclease subunit R [Ectothiorhodospiraceae bacterium AqS1]|nr:type I restriction endonuclease subunit R [Ectothiorhodospiraceae bacterium AqS1]